MLFVRRCFFTQLQSMKGGYYAVRSGRQPGVYDSWAECERQVKGFSKAQYKKFPTLKDVRLRGFWRLADKPGSKFHKCGIRA
jgi:hypothetical protein